MDLSTKFIYDHYTEECNDGVEYNARVEVEPEWLGEYVNIPPRCRDP